MLATKEDYINIHDFEVICVDDGSHDQTIKILKTISNQYNNVRYISFSKNFGQDSALLAGLRETCGDFVVTLDDDRQNSPFEVRKMLAKIESKDDDVFLQSICIRNTYFLETCLAK